MVITDSDDGHVDDDDASGNHYADLDPDVDKLAAYGIGGLIAGKLALKTGLLAMLLKFVAAGWKFILAGLAGLAALVSRAFGRRNA